MTSRNELGKLYQKYNMTGVGAEVGCFDGSFTKILANDYRGKILAIDYFNPSDFLYYGGLKERAEENLRGTNCIVVQAESLDYAEMIADNCLDWVYIDADHRYESALADLHAWYPKVRWGGIVSGHDYIKDYAVNGIEFGVWQAVDEFCLEHGYKINLIHDTVSGADFASWWFIK